jgi:hypothetical protein
MQVTQAYRAVTGDMDQTGLPLRFDGWCDIFVNGIGEASVTITATRPDVTFCIGTTCGTSYTFKWRDVVRSIREIVTIDVFKTPDAPASQLLGGGRSVVDIYIDYYKNEYLGYRTLDVYVNGTSVASCYRRVEVSKELGSWTEYKEPNATAVYLIRFIGERDGRPVVLDGNIVLYEHKDGSFGFRLIVNPVEDPTPEDLNIFSPHMNLDIISPSNATYRGAVSLPFLLAELTPNWPQIAQMGPFLRFAHLLFNDPLLMRTFGDALDKMVDIEFNVPYIAVSGTSEYLVYRETYSRQGGSAALRFKTLSISSLGAVYANAVLPIDIKLPPPVLPQNATRTYIFGYR